jgi:hypothetical protein
VLAFSGSNLLRNGLLHRLPSCRAFFCRRVSGQQGNDSLQLHMLRIGLLQNADVGSASFQREIANGICDR